ncbi:MAG TPA: amino acid adenylation domain-containing protein, partial [Longimicrobium sp.]|nr:amino acid adenylation domain-containing protein [Longimicrobium sp.]
FATLKAGGAYVPLDPEYPEDRLRYMLADSAPAVLLTQAPLAGLFAGAEVPRIRVDADAADWAHQPGTDLQRGALTPEHLVYVIYTSGSTGQPKGVMNQHRTLVNRLAWGRRAWEIDAGEVVLCKTSLSFDGSVREIFLPLTAGARVVLARPGGHRDPSYLLEVIGRERVTTVNLVPSLLQMLLEVPEVENLRGVKRILCAGEALPAALLERFRERLPEVEAHNVYGPSEAATAVAALRCVVDPGRGSVPLGGPTPNARAYVLDGAGEPVPVGVSGELYVGGVGVARGYHDRVRQTAERFVPDPFSAEPGARLYRTGDVVRWQEGGWLEFVGRNDDQVKVRGFRVELGEIEARLCEHAGVREAVVLAREDVPGDRRLVAYVVGDAGVEVEALRVHLSERLPEYMVPAACVRLDALPLTPNGKVDRRALPAPEADAYARRGYVAPRTPAEEAVAAVWTEVLRLERVGAEDDFFELGGHSLLATRVVSRIREAFGCELPLRAIFEHSRLAALAAEVERVRDGGGAAAAGILPRAARRRAEPAQPLAEPSVPAGASSAAPVDTGAAVSVASRAAVPVEPGAAVSIEPEAVVSVEVEAFVSVEPGTAFSIEPEATFSIEPGADVPIEGWAEEKPVPAGGRPADAPHTAPASFAQERLWFLHRMEPESPAYNISAAWRLAGPLDEDALRAALGGLVRRHETLRTTFALVDGAPVQVIAPAAEVPLPVTALGELPADVREYAARRLAEEEADRPFDLEAGPLFRPRLLRLAADDHVLVITLHHVVGDGWSMGVLYAELGALYAAALRGEPAALPELPIQYADYAAWQREELRGEALEAELAWWREHLAGAPPLLQLPTDHPRPAACSYRGAQAPVALPAELVERLRSVARAEGATLFAGLLAAWTALLARWCGQDDVVVGTPVAGRGLPETEGLIGFLANTLALRTDLSGDPGFRELLARVRTETRGALAHAEAPFERVVEELRPDRTLSYAPVVQVVFSLGVPGAGLALEGVRASRLQVERWTAKLDLVMELAEDSDGGVQGWLQYSTQLFEASTIQRLLRHYRTLLDAVAADVDARPGAVELAGDGERAALAAWSGHAVEAGAPRGETLHALFSARAAETPDAVAIVFGGEALTYAQLEARSDALAGALAAGVRAGDRVGLALERSLEVPAAILAVLKAGGSYVPLDAAYPAERLAGMMEDAAVSVVIVRDQVPESLAGFAGRVVSLQRDAAAI